MLNVVSHNKTVLAILMAVTILLLMFKSHFMPVPTKAVMSLRVIKLAVPFESNVLYYALFVFRRDIGTFLIKASPT